MRIEPEVGPGLRVKTSSGNMGLVFLNGVSLKTDLKEVSRLRFDLGETARLSLKEICTVTGGDMTILSASDMDLRLRNGDYIILREDE